MQRRKIIKRAVLTRRMLKTSTIVLPCLRILMSFPSHFKSTLKRSKAIRRVQEVKMMALRILMKKRERAKALTATKRTRKKRNRKTRTWTYWRWTESQSSK